MGNEPKKRHSRARQGKRRNSISLTASSSVICQNCKAIIRPHSLCTACGYYKGRQVIVK